MLKLFDRRRTSPDELRARELLKEYEELTQRLEQIRAFFDLAQKDSDIDALIYEENAVQCRLSALYQRARDMGVHFDATDRRRNKCS